MSIVDCGSALGASFETATLGHYAEAGTPAVHSDMRTSLVMPGNEFFCRLLTMVQENDDRVGHDEMIRASELVSLMPIDFEFPEIGITPSGSIALNWLGPRDEMFVILVDRRGQLGYAFGSPHRKSHGTCAYDFGKIPAEILSEIGAWREIASMSVTA